MMNIILKFIKANFWIILLLILAAYLRFANLGYSDYQGDEIKALYIRDDDTTISEFFFDQRKGPGQFIITFLTKLIDRDYSIEIIHRLPFALAGVLSVYFFYRLINLYFDSRIAWFSSFFMLTNGFFVALSRIVQYQSFVILFMVLALYLFSLSVLREGYRYRGIFWGFFFWALSILFHYDGIFIGLFVAIILFGWYKKNIYKGSDIKAKKALFISLAISGVLLSSFYIPFILNVSKNTLEYWSGRVSGDVSGKLSSSSYLFTVYQPIYVLHFYRLMVLLGFIYVACAYLKKYFIHKLKILSPLLKKMNFNPNSIHLFVAWFIVPFVFMELFVYIPGTHIYTYLLPLFVILSLGIAAGLEILKLFRKYFIPEVVFYFILIFLFSFIFFQSKAIFVENNSEYPWEEEKFVFWSFPRPNPTYHLSLFGFPYFRDWEGIREVVISSKNNGYYSSNERVSITRYYIDLPKDTDRAGYYIYILSPQSFSDKIYQDKAVYWSDRYNPIFTFSKKGKDLVRVYDMPEGSLETIQLQGY